MTTPMMESAFADASRRQTVSSAIDRAIATLPDLHQIVMRQEIGLPFPDWAQANVAALAAALREVGEPDVAAMLEKAAA